MRGLSDVLDGFWMGETRCCDRKPLNLQSQYRAVGWGVTAPTTATPAAPDRFRLLQAGAGQG
jgi:hypothetical protein